MVIAQGVVVDIFAVGGNCALAKLISKRSGGYCYYTDTIIDGVRTFETETILKVGLRQPVSVSLPPITSEDEFTRVSASVPFDREPPRMLRPIDIDGKVCSSMRAFELQVAARTENPLVGKRVLRELARYNHDPHPDFALFPLSKNLFIWRGLVEGPQGTAYEGGIFDFYISFGEGYPGKAPEMRFLTPISHPNVTQNGKICNPIFNTNYTTETSIREILNNVYALLLNQDFDDYVVSNLNITLSLDMQQFQAKAREVTKRYAIRGKTKEQLIMEMMEEDDCPEKYRCPLSGKLMRDPVYSPKSDKTFERAAIEAHLRQTWRDPLTNLPMRGDELYPDIRLKQEIYRLYPL
jgi:ubiquitin-protein ligase